MASSQRPQQALLSNAQEIMKEDFEFIDDSLNRKCLISCFTFLCENLTVVEAIVFLQANEILTQNDVDSIRAKETSYAKNGKLIEFVQQRGPKAFNCFMKSLTETRQKYIFDKLIEERKIAEEKNLSIQRSLRDIYTQIYRNVIPFSLPFFFDVEEKWVDLTLKLEDDSAVTEEYADLLKKAFAKAKMLIIEGNPGIGKSSLMHRLAYEWTQKQSRLNDYDLVLYIEFRKLRDCEFKDIQDMITHYMEGYLDKEDYETFLQFINDTKRCKKHKILVFLDGYDESSLEKQCEELNDYFNSTICKPLRFHVLITSRKGYLSNFRNQGRFIFADIIGFTTETQKHEFISKHFKAANDTESSENTAAVTTLLNNNANLKRLSESPLMLTFICLLHKKIIDGTEVELYMNIIWWMIDRHQKSNPDKDVASLFDFQHDASNKFLAIKNNYQHFPQLHLLGTMAMQDIFKTTFTESDFRKFKLKEIVHEVGLLRKEEVRDTSCNMKIEYSFVHRTIQEFMMALSFFFSDKKAPRNFLWYIIFTARNKNYGIIQAKLQIYLKLIYSSKLKINKTKKSLYSTFMKSSKQLYSGISPQLEHSLMSIINSQDDVVHLESQKERSIPQSSEEAVQLLHDEAVQGDALAQYSLGLMYHFGIFAFQSDEQAVKWYIKSAEQGNADAQCNLGFMYENGNGIHQSDEEAAKRYRKSAEQGNANAEYALGLMYLKGKGVPKSDEEAIKWFTKSAEKGNSDSQFNLGCMYMNGKGVLQSDYDAVKWFTKAAEQGDADAQYNLGNMKSDRKCALQSDEEAVKWYTKLAQQGDSDAQHNLGDMFKNGRGVHQSDEEAVKWYRKSAEQGNAVGQSDLGNMLKNGRGVDQSDEEAAKWFRKSAEQGNEVGQNNLGWMYRNGKGVPQSDEEAFKWFRKSAEQGNAISQCNVGNMYMNGTGIQQSDEEAVNWYWISAEQGNANAQYGLGSMYENGKGVPQSDEEAIKWYWISAEQGNANAQYGLGSMYEKGKGVPQSDVEAVKWYTKSAAQGIANAQCCLGFLYENGKGVPQSDEEAVKWYTKSAEQGCELAQHCLGIMFRCAQGTAQTDVELVKWYRKSAEQGDSDAQFNLGFMYKNGRGVPQSDEEAVKWCRKSAEQGNANAQSCLALSYRKGQGVHQSDKEAITWYIKSAEQGDSDAQCSLGFMYKDGNGVPQSNQEAAKWFRKSAEQGNELAQCCLGMMYKNGRGVPQSDEEAAKWFRKSAEQGNELAQSELRDMRKNKECIIS